MKSLTLSTLLLLWDYIWRWEVSERDTWPHKRPRLAEECRRRFHACDACGLTPETNISDRFLLTLPFCFCVDAENPARTLRHFMPPLSFLCCFCPKREKKDSKSEISTINFQSPILPFFSILLSSDSASGCPSGPVARFPSV